MIAQAWDKVRGHSKHEYTPLPLDEKHSELPSDSQRTHRLRRRIFRYALLWAAIPFTIYFTVKYITNNSCDTIDRGYRCSPKTTHFWGQYSLWFSVPSDINVTPPKGCEVTFANVLSRHGGRDPTLGKSIAYHVLIADIQNNATSYPGRFKFLESYEYDLGADELTDAGRQEMVNSGAHFSRRYSKLLDKHTPFVRAGGQHRVIESAEKWLAGVAQSLDEQPRDIDVVIPEGTKWNNTLSHDTCPAFEGGPDHDLGNRAQRVWASKFVPPIQARVNAALGTELSATAIIYLMDMCPYDTVAHPYAKVSDFCHLFTEEEWHAYDYFQTLGKFYGYGIGNPLGATQGAGYVNELLARLTETPVDDNTNTNQTLDADPATFPLDRKVYADFSHDNDMSGVLAALGLYNKTKPLSKTYIEDAEKTHGFSAAWTVPFAARIYIEKLACSHEEEEFVRIIVNDRVHPLEFCGGDKHGRCALSDFVDSQSFSRIGGAYDRCFD